MITIDKDNVVEPLEAVRVSAPGAHGLTVYDGQGRPYARGAGPKLGFRASGALGHHVVAAFDKDSREIERVTFRVDCTSDIVDDSGRYRHLLQQCLLKCMQECHQGEPPSGNTHMLSERIRRGFVLTSRDHIHGHKAMRYFLNWNRAWIDAFCENQREDGMVWDFLMHRPQRQPTFAEESWGKGWCKVVADGDSMFGRQPVMNDLEHMFIRGIWQTWRTTGDDAWMAGRLDNALRALQYATTSPYTWSEKFGLIHRPFCIDMWDFQSDFDTDLVRDSAAMAPAMMAVPGVSKYGVAHGDSMGLAQACDELSEMLEHAGRTEDARRVQNTGARLRANLDTYCWNGEFFTHFVPEDPTFERPFGVDQSRQVSLSNAYALNRGIPHEQAAAIIRTYQRLREQTRDSAPGEWFCIYPPFPHGFSGIALWHYVNGGVAPMVAGELAHGAFEHGFEAYGVGILSRVADLGRSYDMIPRVWRGMLAKPPVRDVQTLDLRPFANVGFSGTAETKAIPWTKEAENDLHEMPVGRREFQTVLFDVIDPASNSGAACIGISSRTPYAPCLGLQVGRKAASLYFLHTVSGGTSTAGDLAIRYADGTEHRIYIRKGEQIQGWWMPRNPESHGGWPERMSDPDMLVAWRGANAKCSDIGVMVWGLANPFPEKQIERLELKPALDEAVWMVLGITLSDQPVYLPPSGLSNGIPAPWSVGAVIWAMFEGLAGVYDTEPNFRAARISPRWTAGDTSDVTVTAKFEEGGGYVRYRYQRGGGVLRLTIAGNSISRRLEVLLPEGTAARSVRVNDIPATFSIRTIEQSVYACVDLDGLGAQDVVIEELRS